MNNKQMMLKLVCGLSAVAILVAVAGCKKQEANPTAPIRIGAILPLTGDAAQYGNNDREGIQLAVNQANAASGTNGRKVEVIFEDCRMDAKQAISAFNKLRSQGVEVLIDDAISTISLALVPLLEQNKTVLISTGASNPGLSGCSPFFFRIWNSDAYEGEVAARYILGKLGATKIAVLHINSDYGKGLHDVLARQLAGSKAQLVVVETFSNDDKDFRAQVAKIKQAKPNCVYLVGYAAQTGLAAKQLREGGVDTPIVGTVAMEDPEFVKLAGNAAEGVTYPFPTSPTGAVVEQFRSTFHQTYGKDPGLLNDCGFDAANLILKSLKEGATTGEQIRTRLATVSNYVGASGVITFDKFGDVHKPMEMRVVRDGKFVNLP